MSGRAGAPQKRGNRNVRVNPSEIGESGVSAIETDGLPHGTILPDRVIYEEVMLKEYRKILKEHADDVYGVGAHTTLSLYTLLSIACIVVPVTFFIIVIFLKLF